MVDTDGRAHLMDGLAVYRHSNPGTTRVVVVHGSMDRGASFIKTARRLRDLDIVRYDRRGYGRSVAGGTCGSFGEQVDDLLTVLDEEPAVVVGHSLGGLVALAAASRRADLVRSVAAFEAPMPWLAWWPARSAGGDAVAAAGEGGPDAPAMAVERFMRRMIGDERWEGLPPATREARRLEGPALLSDLAGVRSVLPPFEVEDIEVPILAGKGSESDVHHQRGAVELAAHAPNGALVEIEGAGHGAHFSHPEDFAQFIRFAVERAGPAATQVVDRGR